jgi:hypothetical protein
MALLQHLLRQKVDYKTNSEFRSCIRSMFQMNPEAYREKLNTLRSLEDLDEETEDEISYDDASAKDFLDQIYEKTKNHTLFQQAFSIAASNMMSEDPTIGLAVLFCYDYLPFFYFCLVEFLESPTEFTKENNHYISLMKKIS